MFISIDATPVSVAAQAAPAAPAAPAASAAAAAKATASVYPTSNSYHWSKGRKNEPTEWPSLDSFYDPETVNFGPPRPKKVTFIGLHQPSVSETTEKVKISFWITE